MDDQLNHLAAHMMQMWMTGDFILQFPDDTRVHVVWRVPTYLVPMEGTTGEVSWAALRRVLGDFERLVDRYVEQIEEVQKTPVWRGVGNVSDSAGSNFRVTRKEKQDRPGHYFTFICDTHMQVKCFNSAMEIAKKDLPSILTKAHHRYITSKDKVRLSY